MLDQVLSDVERLLRIAGAFARQDFRVFFADGVGMRWVGLVFLRDVPVAVHALWAVDGLRAGIYDSIGAKYLGRLERVAHAHHVYFRYQSRVDLHVPANHNECPVDDHVYLVGLHCVQAVLVLRDVAAHIIGADPAFVFGETADDNGRAFHVTIGVQAHIRSLGNVLVAPGILGQVVVIHITHRVIIDIRAVPAERRLVHPHPEIPDRVDRVSPRIEQSRFGIDVHFRRRQGYCWLRCWCWCCVVCDKSSLCL